MSRRARQSTGTISLFPFLAVLVCAMGALILLLLVTTRRIRQRTQAEQTLAGSAAQDEAGLVANESAPAPALITTNGDDSAVAAGPKLSDKPIQPLLVVDPPAPEPQRPDLTAALLSQLAALKVKRQALDAAVAKRQEEIARAEAAAAAESTVLSNLQNESRQTTADKQRLNNLYQRLREQQKSVEQRAENLQQDLQHARVQLTQSDSKFSLVPYDGDSGTTRRPLIIECTQTGLAFVSEGITLTPSDLDGFTPRYNPLLYAAQALGRYWQRRDRASSSDTTSEPYLLLVVRPGGTTAYYVARALLAGMRAPFGYELVTDDQDFSWPDSDPEAKEICRLIIERMLAERNELAEVAVNQGARLSDFSDDQGRFRLKEIDRLKNPTREVTINGQRFDRSLGNRGGRFMGGSESSGREAAPPVRFSPEDSLSRRAASNLETDRMAARSGGPLSTGSGVHTQQQSAVTRADRMPEWLREGTTRLDASKHRLDSVSDNSASDQSPGSTLSPHRDSTRNTPGSDSPGHSASPQEQPTAARNPSSSLSVSGEHRGRESAIDSIRPQWGLRNANGTIGYEREVRIHVSSTQVTIEEDSAFQLDRNMPTSALRRLLAAAVDREVRAWGDPPRSFYWVPSIRFLVGPGAGASQQHLKSIVETWGLRSSVEYTAQ